MSIKILLVTHGKYAEETYNTTADIMGKSDDVRVFGISRCQGIEDIKKELGQIVEDIIKQDELLILVDMIGGTPMNLSVPFLKNEKVEVISGVNMPMLITAMNRKNQMPNIKELADVVCDMGQKSIVNLKKRIDL
jgi:PTS system mannose-specific IIA component